MKGDTDDLSEVLAMDPVFRAQIHHAVKKQAVRDVFANLLTNQVSNNPDFC